MSGEEAGTSCCCASCGKAEVDDAKLKDCDECNLVKYCSDECMEDHRSQHEEACKKRAAELRDELLFKQPEGSCYGDCPICCLPLSLVQSESSFKVCCSKLICNGCMYANQKREIEMKLQVSCPFCRKATPKTKKECERRVWFHSSRSSLLCCLSCCLTVSLSSLPSSLPSSHDAITSCVAAGPVCRCIYPLVR